MLLYWHINNIWDPQVGYCFLLAGLLLNLFRCTVWLILPKRLIIWLSAVFNKMLITTVHLSASWGIKMSFEHFSYSKEGYCISAWNIGTVRLLFKTPFTYFPSHNCITEQGSQLPNVMKSRALKFGVMGCQTNGPTMAWDGPILLTMSI